MSFRKNLNLTRYLIFCLGLFLLFQNCDQVHLSTVTETAGPSKTDECADTSEMMPEHIYEDASLNADFVTFKMNEINKNQEILSSTRSFDWFIDGVFISSGSELTKSLSEFTECVSHEINAEIVLCGKNYSWKKSYMKPGSRCASTTTTTTLPPVTDTACPPPQGKEMKAYYTNLYGDPYYTETKRWTDSGTLNGISYWKLMPGGWWETRNSNEIRWSSVLENQAEVYGYLTYCEGYAPENPIGDPRIAGYVPPAIALGSNSISFRATAKGSPVTTTVFGLNNGMALLPGLNDGRVWYFVLRQVRSVYDSEPTPTPVPRSQYASPPHYTESPPW